MDGERRLAVYARVNGHRRRALVTMTPKQRRRYWQKWFKGVYVEPVLLGAEEGALREAVRKARLDREAPVPKEAWPSWQEDALPGEDFWGYMDRRGVRWM